MNPAKTTVCPRCDALRWVEQWKESEDEIMSITLGPCGHQVERQARLEWAISSFGHQPGRLVNARPARRRVATP
jgi:Zn ribbon nucleic-acid-binding protein